MLDAVDRPVACSVAVIMGEGIAIGMCGAG